MDGAVLAVPRRVDVPFHVAVEREPFAREVVREVVRVAHAAEQQREPLVRLQPPHRRVHANPRAVAKARIVVLREELALLDVVPVRRVRLVHHVVVHRRRADVRVVADEEHDRSVRAAANGVRTVVAHAGTRVALNALDRVHHVVAVGVLELVEARDTGRGILIPPPAAPLWLRARRHGGRRGIAGHHGTAVRIQRPVLQEQAVAGVQLRGDDLFPFVKPVAVRVEKQARRAPVSGSALRDDRAPEAVEGDDDVGLGLVGRRDPVDLEARQQGERRSWRERLILCTLGGRLGSLPGVRPGREDGDREQAETQIPQACLTCWTH